MMAASTSVVGGRSDPNEGFSGQTYFFLAPLVIPLLILGVPILDFLYAVIRRAAGRSGLTVADKNHLHHRLMRLGHGQRRSVLILWLGDGAALGLVLYPTYTGEGDAFVPLGAGAGAHPLHRAAPRGPPEPGGRRGPIGRHSARERGGRRLSWLQRSVVPAPAPDRPAAGRPAPRTEDGRPRHVHATITPRPGNGLPRIRPAITPSGMPITSPTRASVAAPAPTGLRTLLAARPIARSTARSLRRPRPVTKIACGGHQADDDEERGQHREALDLPPDPAPTAPPPPQPDPAEAALRRHLDRHRRPAR